ncbi:MAG TPA: autotransporter outer membrane beta-barrel domain-containing protein [Rhizomicrobium sp.]
MTKRALMLTAATVALLSGPATAQDFSDITTEVDQQLLTSTAKDGAPSDILIESSGSVVVTVAGPAIEIDSPNSVTNKGKITNLDTDFAIGVELDATAAGNGPGDGIVALDNFGTIDLSGKGTGKTGILIGIANEDTSGIFTGDIMLEAASSVKVVGDGSIGMHFADATTFNGDVTIDGNLGAVPSDTKSTSAGQVVGLRMDGDINGNILIGTSGNLVASGFGAQGMMLFGDVNGSLTNEGHIGAIGTASPVSGGINPEANSALVVAGNITGGILNEGPAYNGDNTSLGSLTLTGNSFAVFMSPIADGATGGLTTHIGLYDDTRGGLSGYSFINRGNIIATPVDPDNSASAVRFLGAGDTVRMILDGGFFNSGEIFTSAVSDTKGTGSLLSNAFWVGQFASVPTLFNSATGRTGTIQASLSGALGGTAYAVHVDADGFLGSIVNEGSISAVATTTDTTIAQLAAYGISDEAGTITSITNSGTIAAIATALDNDAQIARAIDLHVSQQNIMIDNSGVIIGDVLLGNGADTILLHESPSGAAASITGDIDFGGTAGGGDDSLMILDNTTVKGAISDGSGGRLDVDVGGGSVGGTLTLTNDSTDIGERFIANNFLIEDGGNLGLTLSQTYNIAANPTAGGIVTTTGDATLDPQARLNLSFGSFLTSPGANSQFILIDALNGALSVDLNQLDNQVCANLPFLFETNNNQCLAIQSGTGADQQLVMTLTPKSAAEMNLSGYALKMFPLANEALANDDELGAAVINAGLPVNGIPLTDAAGDALYQKIYSAFAPNITGAARTLAISITDQATGPVGARQRALRMYAAQSGDATLWGQEFGNNLNQDPSANTGGYRDTGFGFTLGLDGGNPSDGRYGGALTFYSGDVTEKSPRDTKTTSEFALLTGYTDWRGRGFFLDTQLTGGYGSLDGKRYLNLGGVSRVAEGKRNTLLAAGGLTTGVILTSGRTVFTPLISVDGLTMREDGYSEGGGGAKNAGGDGFDLKISPAYFHSVRGFAGADLRQDINFGDFFLQPEIRGGYRYDFAASPEKLTAEFLSTGDSFTLTGPDPDKGNAVLGGSLSATTDVWSVGVHYDYLRGQNGSVSQTGTVTLVGRI